MAGGEGGKYHKKHQWPNISDVRRAKDISELNGWCLKIVDCLLLWL